MENKDLIDRKALIDWFMPYIHSGIDNIPAETVIEDIKAIPFADAVPVVHGKWVCTNRAYGNYECTACGGMDSDCSDYYSSHNVTDQEYCPWCGAKMDGVEK